MILNGGKNTKRERIAMNKIREQIKKICDDNMATGTGGEFVSEEGIDLLVSLLTQVTKKVQEEAKANIEKIDPWDCVSGNGEIDTAKLTLHKVIQTLATQEKKT